MVGIPQSLAYAELAGMPPLTGLYAGALPPLVAAFFASSPYLQTGPVAVTALLTYSALSTVAVPASPEYVGLGLGLALIVGVSRLLLGLLRGGWLAYLMSQPMLLGFVPAAAVLIAASQVPNVLDVVPHDADNEVVSAALSLLHPAQWSLVALTMAAMTVVVVIGARRLHPLVPGVLLAAVAGIAITAVGWYSGTVVGPMPSGFLPFTLDDIPWGRLPTLVLPGVVIALVGFSEAASISRRFAAEDGQRWSSNREFVSQGAANIAAAAFGGMPCGGSFSRSSVGRMSGAKTRWAGAVNGLAVLAFLPLASLLEPLPLAVLGATVIVAVMGLLRFRPLLRLWRLSPPQAIVAWTTFVATLLLAPRLDLAVLIGVGLSLAIFLWRLLHLDVDVTEREGALTFTPRGVLWFGTAQRLDVVLFDALERYPNTNRVVVDLTRIGRVDTTGALALRSMLDHARNGQRQVEVRGIPPQSRRLTEQILDSPTSPLD